jgi:hypothetical protein
MFVPHRQHTYGPPRPVMWIALRFLYIHDVRTSQETQASMTCCGDRFTFVYVDDVRNSQETQACTARYGDNLFYFSVWNQLLPI